MKWGFSDFRRSNIIELPLASFGEVVESFVLIQNKIFVVVADSDCEL
jgi:hypothetical protein